MQLDDLLASEHTASESVRQCIDAGDFEGAIKGLHEMLVIANRMKAEAPDAVLWMYSQARAMYQMGTLHVKLGDVEQALEYLDEALSLSRELVAVDPIDACVSLLARTSFEAAFVVGREGDLETAISLLTDAEATCQALCVAEDTAPNRSLWAECLARLARVYHRVNLPEQARAKAEAALQLYLKNMETPNPPLEHVGLLYELLGTLDVSAGDLEAADRNTRYACDWLRRDVARNAEVTAKCRLYITLVVRVDVERKLGNDAVAQALIAEADDVYGEVPESFRGFLENAKAWLEELRVGVA